jgi:hypothetical protein
VKNRKSCKQCFVFQSKIAAIGLTIAVKRGLFEAKKAPG